MIKQEFKIGVAAGIFVFSFLLFAFLLNVFTFNMLWNWFVSPLGVQKIGFMHSFGIMTFINYIKLDILCYMSSQSKEEQMISLGILNMYFTLVCLILGFIIHILM